MECTREDLHVTGGLEDFVRSEHRALESHHLLGSDKVIPPHIDNMALKALEWRTVIEKTL